MSDDNNCEPLVVINEVYIVNIPSVIFFVTGAVNFYLIRSIGFNRVVQYSTLFKVKRYTVLSIIILDVIKVLVFLLNQQWWMKNVPVL